MSPQLNFLLSFFILFFLFIMIKSSNVIGVKYGTNSTSCPLFVCGGVTIAYPFWRLDDNTNTSDRMTQNITCGYPDLGVNCSTMETELSVGFPIISLPAGETNYSIRDINYDTQTLTVVDDEVTNQRCPRPRNNVTLLGGRSGTSSSSLSFSNLDLKLIFYFNCTSSRFDSGIMQTACLQSGEKRTYFAMANSYDSFMEEDSQWYEECDEKVEKWVISNELNIDREDIEIVGVLIGKAFDKGFLLNWQLAPDTDCFDCEGSGGRCGFQDTRLDFIPGRNFYCICDDGSRSVNGSCRAAGRRQSLMMIMLGVVAVALPVGIVFAFFIYCYLRMPSFSERSLAFLGLRSKNDNNIEAFITQYKFSTPRRYKYSEIKRMTNAFKDVLGRGGFGSVFKGTLVDGSLVAVKVLKKSKGSGEDFMNEVASIGRTSHVNIVALKGFCYEGPKRALIYDFMPNGSLEKFIFQNTPKDGEQCLGVEKLYEIALGIARGLEYLHRGCNTRILHFDIKPHNILLDEDFCPKISDFGLAKLHSSKESIMSMVEARGTIGYIAPEVFNRNFGGVSHKADVYSYGMMVVEMVGGRKNLDVGVVSSSEIYFPQWIYKRLELDEDLLLLSPGPMTAVENEIARKMIIIGLWCIQADPSQRPSMNKVIEMLVGSMEALTLPPTPFFSSPPRTPASSSTTLESISSDEVLQIAE